MIVMGLMGGLGNQLFQYCTGRRLSLKLGVELGLDPSFLRQDFGDRITPRPYLLDRFHIAGRVVPAEELGEFIDGEMPGYRIAMNRMAVRMTGHSIFRNPVMFFERDKNFEPAVLDLPDDRYLHGYFQSDRYFRDVRNTILKDLTVKDPMDQANQCLASEIKGYRSVCLHVRRGDYITNKDANRILGVDLTDYYRQAVKRMNERLGECHYFIFSDEPDWVRRNLDIGKEFTAVDINSPDKAEQDLRLMSMCENFIIANSSFSWWGAWLSQNPDKVVIAPKRWFLDDRDVSDRCPADWIRI